MFNIEIENQINFFISAKIVDWNPRISEIDLKEIIINNNNFIFYTNQEVYSENFDKLLNLLDEFPEKTIYISQATSTSHRYGFYPIVNLLHFCNVDKKYYNPMKENVVWQLGKNEIGWDESYFKFNNEIYYKNLLKSNRGILSVRKQNPTRDVIFDNITKFNGILRYIKVPMYFNSVRIEDFTDVDFKMNDNPSTSELVKEYCKSFISFVIETDSENAELNPLTEKTLLSFMTQTLPVLYGGKNYIKELNDMGFYVFNEELGFDTDMLDYSDSKKINNFIKMIENYNKLSYSDIKKIYRKNYDNIKNNYDIIWQLFSKKVV